MITASEANTQTLKVQNDQMTSDMERIQKMVERAIRSGEFSAFIQFTHSLKELILKELDSLGYKTVSAGNVQHNGLYQIKISW